MPLESRVEDLEHTLHMGHGSAGRLLRESLHECHFHPNGTVGKGASSVKVV